MMKYSSEKILAIGQKTKDILNNIKHMDAKLYIVDFTTKNFIPTYQQLSENCVNGVFSGEFKCEGRLLNKPIEVTKPVKASKPEKSNDLDRLADSLLSPSKPKRKRSVKKTA